MAPILTPEQVEARGVDLDGARPDQVAGLVARFEDLVYRARGYRLAPTSATATRRARWGVVELPHVPIISAEIPQGDDPPRVLDLDDTARRLGRLQGVGYGLVTIDYVHGLAVSPEAALDACALFVGRSLATERSGTSRDVLSQSFDGGTTRYSTPDWSAGRWTGWLDVDQAVNEMPDMRMALR